MHGPHGDFVFFSRINCSRLRYGYLFQVQCLQRLHAVVHKIEVDVVNLASNLQIGYFGIVELSRCNGILQSSSRRAVHHHILFCRGIVAHEVVLPRCDALADERELILSATGFLVYANREIAHLAGHIGKRLVLGKLIGHAAYGDAEQRFASLYGLRHHDGTPLVARARWHGGRGLHAAVGGHGAVGQIDAGLAYQVGGQHGFLRSSPFACCKAATLNQRHAGVGHTVFHGQTYHTGGRRHVGHLSPQKVAGFVAAHLAVLRRLALVALHLKLVVVHALGVGKRIISVHVDVGVLVFPVEVVGRVPLIVRLVERVAHVVATVAAGLQRAWCAAVIIDNVHAHHVAVAEAVVVDARHRQLVDVAGELYAVVAVLLSPLFKHVVGAGTKQQGNNHSSQIYYCVFVILVHKTAVWVCV